MKSQFYVVPFEKFFNSTTFVNRKEPIAKVVKSPQSRARSAAKLLIALAVIPMGLVSISPSASAQVPTPGCRCVGGYRYVGGTGATYTGSYRYIGGRSSTYSHGNGSTYRWDNCYMQSCSAQRSQQNSSPVVPASVARGSSVIVSTNGGTLNARSGPGTNYPVMTRLPNGTTLQLSGSSQGAWVQLVNGSWVNSAYLRAAR